MRAYEKNPVPREIFGYGSSKVTGERLKALGCTRALVITDKGLMQFGVAGPIIDNIRKAGLEVIVYDTVQPDAPDTGITECFHIIRDDKCDALVAIGGGSVLDTAKVAGVFTGVPDEEPTVQDYCVTGGRMKPTYARKNLVAVYMPTTSGTGAEATCGAVVNDTVNNLKVQVMGEKQLPDLIIVDPMLTMDLPPRTTINTGIDAIAHCIEHLIGASQLDFQDLILFDCLKRAWQWLPIVVENPHDQEGREQMSWAAHQALCNGGFSNSHALAHAIGGTYHEYKLLHGTCCAWVVGTSIRWHADSRAKQIRGIADAFGVPYVDGEDNKVVADRVACSLAKFCRNLGIKSLQDTFTELGINVSKEEFVDVISEAAMHDALVSLWTPPIHEDRAILRSIVESVWNEQ